MTHRLAAIALALAIITVAAGPSLTVPTLAAATTSPTSPVEHRIAIGIDAPLTGTDASDGQPLVNGAVLAIEDANRRGFGGRTFHLEPDVRDDAVQGKHNSERGARNARLLAADPDVVALIGPLNSNVAAAQIPLVNAARLVQISPSATNDTLTVGPESDELRGARPKINTFFRTCARDSRQGGALGRFAYRLGWRSVYVVDDGEIYGKGLASVFAETFAAAGGKILQRDDILADESNLTALLSRIRAARPDAVFFGGTTSTGAARLRRQMRDFGLGATPFMGGDGISGQEFLKDAGGMADNTYFSIAAPDTATLANTTFIAAYKKRFHVDPGTYSASAYAAAQIEIAAIEQAIKDDGGKMPSRLDVLRNVASTSSLNTVIGSVGFDQAGDTTTPVLTLKRIDHGKQFTVDQLTLLL